MEREALLSVDEFNVPKEINNLDVVNLKFIRLMMFEPGTDPDQPNKGLGLVSRFRYIKPEDLGSLEDELTDQINKYCPRLVGVKVEMTMTMNRIDIAITADETLYEYRYDGKNIKQLHLRDV